MEEKNKMRISVGELQRFFFRAWLFLLVVCLSSACNKYSTSDPNSPISQELAQVKSELTNLRDQLQKQINEINELLNNPNSGLTAEEKEKLTKLRDELQKELDTVNDLIKKVDDLIASGGTVTQEELDAIKKATDDVKSQAEKTLEKTKEYVPSPLESIDVTKSTILILKPVIFTLDYTDSKTEEPSYEDGKNKRYDSTVSSSKMFVDTTITFKLNPATVNRNTTNVNPVVTEECTGLEGKVKAVKDTIEGRVVSIPVRFEGYSADNVANLTASPLFKLICNVTPSGEGTKSATASVTKMSLENLKIYDKNTNVAIYQYCYQLKQYYRDEIKNVCNVGGTLNLRDVVYVSSTTNGAQNNPIYQDALYSYGLDFKFELTYSFGCDAEGVTIDDNGVFHVNQKISELNHQVAVIRVSIIKRGSTYKDGTPKTIEAYDYGYIGVSVQ